MTDTPTTPHPWQPGDPPEGGSTAAPRPAAVAGGQETEEDPTRVLPTPGASGVDPYGLYPPSSAPSAPPPPGAHAQTPYPSGFGQGGPGGHPQPGYPQPGYPPPGYPQQPAYPPPGGYPGGHPQGYAPATPRGAAARREANALTALFDFSFTTYATPGLVRIVYLLTVVASVGSWVLWVLMSFGMDAMGSAFGGLGVLTLLFGWIPALLTIAFTRFVLEGVVALIRMSERTAEIAARLDDTDAG